MTTLSASWLALAVPKMDAVVSSLLSSSYNDHTVSKTQGEWLATECFFLW